MCIVCAQSDPSRYDQLLQPHDFRGLTGTQSGFFVRTDPDRTKADQEEGGDGPIFNDVPDDVTTPATLTPGGTYEGEIETAGDVDWIKVTLTAGETYNFVVEGRYNYGNWTLDDADMSLVDASGTILVSDMDSGWVYDAQFFYTAVTSGDYYLVVNRGSRGPDTGTYQIESEIITLDPGSSMATAGTLSVNSGLRAAIETTSDSDWYAFTVRDGAEYAVTAAGVFSSDANTLSDNKLTIYDASGNVVYSATDGANSYDASIRFTATEDATYYVVVEGENGEIGTYGLRADELIFYTNDEIADQLNSGYWGGTQRAWDLSGGRQITVDITALDALGQETARYALQSWTDVLGIEFIEVTSGAQLSFDDENSGAYASSSREGGFITSSFINVAKGWSGVTSFAYNNYLTQTYIHEIGHSLGLGHGGNYNGNATYGDDNLYANDSWQATVMSYFSQSENTVVDASFAYVVTPQIADILAARALYGFSGNTRTGDTIYGVGNDTGIPIYDETMTNVSYTIVDDGGIDTIVGSLTSSNTISLVAETFSSLFGETNNVAIARGVVIENATGGNSADFLYGNSADNVLTGNGGNDVFRGGGGYDFIYGGDGTNDIIELTGAAYTDYLSLQVGTNSYVLLDMNLADGDDGFIYVQDVESVELGDGTTLTVRSEDNIFDVATGDANAQTIGGTNARDAMAGFEGNDTLNGLDGDDVLAGGDGDDILNGGLGSDILLGGDGFDTASYAAAASGISASLRSGSASGGDRLFEIEGLTGSAYNDVLIGNNITNDVIDGGDGNDGLRGSGGDDTVLGGAGNDLLFLDQGADALDGGSGVDTLMLVTAAAPTNIRLDLGRGYLGIAEGDTYTNIENVAGSRFRDIIVGDGGANRLDGRNGDDLLVGGGGSDTLIGGSGSDRLDGGLGFDTMTGGAGTDTFVFERGYRIDTVTDFENGTDQIDLSSFEFADFNQVLFRASQDNADLLLDFGNGDFLRISNFDLADLDATDVIL